MIRENHLELGLAVSVRTLLLQSNELVLRIYQAGPKYASSGIYYFFLHHLQYMSESYKHVLQIRPHQGPSRK